MLIIDPEKDCARIYTEDYVTTIKGNPQEVCDAIEQRVMAYNPYTLDYKNDYVQVITPSVVTGGVGDYYIVLLEDKGIHVKKICPKAIGVFLPKLKNPS